MAKGKLTALSESRWKYVTGGKTKYIAIHRDTGRWTATDDGGEHQKLDGVDSIESAVDAVDGVRPSVAVIASSLGHGIITFNVPSKSGCAHCSGPGASAECPFNPVAMAGVVHYACKTCGKGSPKGHQCKHGCGGVI